jgi:hypothetical protein
MAGETQGNGKDSGGAVASLRCPVLHVTFDPRTCAVEITGESPSLFFSKYMLAMALEKVSLHLAEAQQPMIELPGGAIPFRNRG